MEKEEILKLKNDCESKILNLATEFSLETGSDFKVRVIVDVKTLYLSSVVVSHSIDNTFIESSINIK